jgi:hypothetical protein
MPRNHLSLRRTDQATRSVPDQVAQGVEPSDDSSTDDSRPTGCESALPRPPLLTDLSRTPEHPNGYPPHGFKYPFG